MSPVCSLPHDRAPGYCPTCGLSLESGPGPGVACPRCAMVSDGGAFCEGCGAGLAPASPTDADDPSVSPAVRPRWWAVLSADRRYFEAVGGPERGFVLPDVPRREVALGTLARIGRSDDRGPRPEIDLDGPPPDPGVSREHARLSLRDDGGWELRDCGSRNGTYVGGHRLRGDEAVRLSGAETIRLGLWSRVELVADRDEDGHADGGGVVVRSGGGARGGPPREALRDGRPR